MYDACVHVYMKCILTSLDRFQKKCSSGNVLKQKWTNPCSGQLIIEARLGQILQSVSHMKSGNTAFFAGMLK